MTYRGVVKNGVIVIEGGELPEGMSVRISPEASAKRKRKKSRGSRSAGSDEIPGFGMWKDRKDWKGKSSVQIARELRRLAMGERYRG